MPFFEISLDELVTSDTHYGHTNVITYCNRPFKDADHMDTVMLANHMEIVGDRRFFHLGDWAFRGKGFKASIAQRMTGYGVIVKGNHDPGRSNLVNEFGFKEAYLEAEGRFIETGQTFYMSHIPDQERAKQYDLAFCGHVHLLFAKSGNTINVGADIWGYRPQTFRHLIENADAMQAARPVQLDIERSLDARDRGIQQRLMSEKT
jgi:calcineurin-like phosphoesterase family protein